MNRAFPRARAAVGPLTPLELLVMLSTGYLFRHAKREERDVTAGFNRLRPAPKVIATDPNRTRGGTLARE